MSLALLSRAAPTKLAAPVFSRVHQPSSRFTKQSDAKNYDPERNVNWIMPNPAHRYRWTWDEQEEKDNPLDIPQRKLKEWMVDESIPELERPTVWNTPKDEPMIPEMVTNPKWINITFVSSQGERKTVRAISDVDTLTSVAVRNKIFHIWPVCGGTSGCEHCHCYVPNELAEKRPITRDELEIYSGRDIQRYKSNSRMACQIRLRDDMDGMTFGLPPYLDKTYSIAVDDFEGISDIQPPSLRVSSSGREMDDGTYDAVDGVPRKLFQRSEFPDPGKQL